MFAMVITLYFYARHAICRQARSHGVDAIGSPSCHCRKYRNPGPHLRGDAGDRAKNVFTRWRRSEGTLIRNVVEDCASIGYVSNFDLRIGKKLREFLANLLVRMTR